MAITGEKRRQKPLLLRREGDYGPLGISKSGVPEENPLERMAETQKRLERLNKILDDTKPPEERQSWEEKFEAYKKTIYPSLEKGEIKTPEDFADAGKPAFANIAESIMRFKNFKTHFEPLFTKFYGEEFKGFGIFRFDESKFSHRTSDIDYLRRFYNAQLKLYKDEPVPASKTKEILARIEREGASLQEKISMDATERRPDVAMAAFVEEYVHSLQPADMPRKIAETLGMFGSMFIRHQFMEGIDKKKKENTNLLEDDPELKEMYDIAHESIEYDRKKLENPANFAEKAKKSDPSLISHPLVRMIAKMKKIRDSDLSEDEKGLLVEMEAGDLGYTHALRLFELYREGKILPDAAIKMISEKDSGEAAKKVMDFLPDFNPNPNAMEAEEEAKKLLSQGDEEMIAKIENLVKMISEPPDLRRPLGLGRRLNDSQIKELIRSLRPKPKKP